MTTKITDKNISNLANFAVDWQSVITADGSTNTTAVAGKGYFIDTTSAAHTIVLPASPSFGDTIIINDYASTFATNNVTINPNGNKIEASTLNASLTTNDQTHTLVYTDSTQGWKIINQDTASAIQPTFITATGGSVTTSGDYKIHTFTGDGCFVVSTIGSGGLGGPSNVDYLVVAGGGGGSGRYHGGGGGAGGFRTTFPSPGCNAGAFPISVTTFPITVGSGGAGGANDAQGTSGSNSTFSTITSSGGGGGGNYGVCSGNGVSGGSGGGGSTTGSSAVGGTGNTPPVNPPQGNNGGTGTTHAGPEYGAGGGGGAGAVGSNGTACVGGAGGNGLANSITGSSVTRAGGGGGSSYVNNPASGAGGTGGGGAGTATGTGGSGTANTGGGGGGAGDTGGTSGAGGKGIVIIRYKYQ